MIGAAHQLQRRLASGSSHIADVVDGLVERPDQVEPPEDVQAPISAWYPAVAADRDGHVAAAAVQLVGELHAGGGRAHDEHTAGGTSSGLR